jgi:beta-N-acetylhexosaminidase
MADQLGRTRKGIVLDELRSVPGRTALAFFAGGAVVAILLALVIDSGGSAATPKTAKRGPNVVVVRSGHHRKSRRNQVPLQTEAESPPREAVSIPRLVGQRFIVGLREADPSAALLQDARRGEIGGVLIFAENSTPAAVGAAAARLQRAARAGNNPPLLIATDQEGGPVKRFPAGPPDAELSSLSAAGALREGRATGSYLREYGIDTDFAPVVDLGLPGSFIAAQGRTISSDPRRVARVAGAFSSGLSQTVVMPVAKHFPGLGGAPVNSDEGRSVVEAGVGASLIPYEALISKGIPAIMISTAIYTKLDPSNGASWSRKIVGGLLRGKLGFRGLAISDDLSTAGVAASLSTPAAVVASAAAGVDMLMVGEPDSFRSAYEAVLKAAGEGRISPRNLSASYRRIRSAKEGFGG